MREVKAQTRVLKSHLEERLKRQLGWSEPLATWLVRHSANCLYRYRIQTDRRTPDQRLAGKRWRRQTVEFGERESSIPTGRGTARRTRGRRCGETDGWHFRWSSERTGASLFLSERALLRGTRVQQKTADAVSETTNSFECSGDACTGSKCQNATAEA